MMTALALPMEIEKAIDCQRRELATAHQR